jgi:hypothetical protein
MGLPDDVGRNHAEFLRNSQAMAGLLTKIPRVLSFPRFPCEGSPGPKVQRAAFFVGG